jgi:streptogramin lyase
MTWRRRLLVAVAAALITAVPAAGSTGGMREYALPTPNVQPLSIVTGPDGNLWFTEFRGNKIGRMAPDGTLLAEYPIPTTVPPTPTNPTGSSQPDEIDVGPDDSLWFAEVLGNKIGRITTAGVITEFAVPTPNSRPTVIAPGPDGNLWFTERGTVTSPGTKIGRITPTGAITEYTVPTAGSRPLGITAGPDGNVWFTEQAGNKVGRINPQTLAIDEFALPNAASAPWEITAGPDGNLWFTEFLGNRVARVTPEGVIAEFGVPTAGSQPNTIRRGPDPNPALDCAFQRESLGRRRSGRGTAPSAPASASSRRQKRCGSRRRQATGSLR